YRSWVYRSWAYHSYLRLFVENFRAFASHPHTAATLDPVTHARRDAAAGEQHHVRNRHRAFPLRDSALDLPLRLRPPVALDHAHGFHQNAARIAKHLEHAAGLAFIFPGDHLHGVVFLDLDLDTRTRIVLMPLRNLLRHSLYNLRRERHDFHEALVAQLTS